MLNFKYRIMGNEALSRELANIQELHSMIVIDYIDGYLSGEEALVMMNFLDAKDKMIRYYLDRNYD